MTGVGTGDAEARLVYRPVNAAERAFLAQSGKLSEVATMRAMARIQSGDRRSLIELKAVDPAYPLYGAVALAPAQSLGDALDRLRRDDHDRAQDDHHDAPQADDRRAADEVLELVLDTLGRPRARGRGRTVAQRARDRQQQHAAKNSRARQARKRSRMLTGATSNLTVSRLRERPVRA